MEEKLKAYRRQQQRQAFFENIRIRLRNMINPPRKEPEVRILVDVEEELKDTVKLLPDGQEPSISSSEEEELIETKPQEQPIEKHWKYCLFALYFIFWATCYAIAIQLQFGAVFLIISALVGICVNTRTGPKPKNEVSAYSVFNKNVESIDGTLKAEQFEREIRYGSMSVR